MHFILLILSAMVLGQATATEISFVVYHSSGNITKSPARIGLRKGDKLSDKDIVVLGEKAKLILVCKNYKVIQVNNKGTYQVKNLTSSCVNNSAGFSSSYFKYIWDEFTNPRGEPGKNPEKYMKNVGAVSRGCPMVKTSLLMDTLHYTAGKLPVYWESVHRQPHASLYSDAETGLPVVKISLSVGTPVRMETLVKGLMPGEYYWQITESDGSSCDRNYLKIWEPAAYKKELDGIFKNLPVSSKAETAFLKGYLMEENHFLAEAMKYYQEAASLQPENSLYQKTISKFYEISY